MLFSKAVDMYWEDKSKRLRGNTLEGYASALRCHVLPAWGNREVESIAFDEVQAWVDSIPTYGAAIKAFKTFRQVYRWVLRRRQLRVWDVTQGIELPEAPVVRRDALTAAEERSALRAVVGQEWEAVVLCAAALGLRRCEACGLDWSDVDWRTGWVHVQRGAHWVGGEVVEYATKTKLSDRWLRLPRFALERLRRIRGSRRSGRMRGSLAPHQIAGRFRRLCRRAGAPLGADDLPQALVGDDRARGGGGHRGRERRARALHRGHVHTALSSEFQNRGEEGRRLLREGSRGLAFRIPDGSGDNRMRCRARGRHGRDGSRSVLRRDALTRAR